MTRDGRQLSAEWTDKRLARLAQQHPDPRLRQLASDILSLKEVHPEKVQPQLHSLSIGGDSYRVFGVNSKSGAVEGLVSENFGYAVAQANLPGRCQPGDVPGRDPTFAAVRPDSGKRLGPRNPCPSRHAASRGSHPGQAGASIRSGSEGVPGAVVEAAAAESGMLAKTLPVAAKTLGRAAMVADGGVRVYQAYEVEQQYQRGEISDRDRVVAHAKNGAGMATAWTAAVALSSQGDVWGSAFGPVGTVGGGVIGGVGGYFGGEKLAEVVVDQGADVIHSGVNAARDAATWVGGQATHLWGLTKSRLGW